MDDIAESDPALKKLMIKYKNQFYNGLDGSITDTGKKDEYRQVSNISRTLVSN